MIAARRTTKAKLLDENAELRSLCSGTESAALHSAIRNCELGRTAQRLDEPGVMEVRKNAFDP